MTFKVPSEKSKKSLGVQGFRPQASSLLLHGRLGLDIFMQWVVIIGVKLNLGSGGWGLIRQWGRNIFQAYDERNFQVQQPTVTSNKSHCRVWS